MENNIVIIGGGIAGIYSALLYSEKGFKVTLVEKEKELGGLLRSQELFEEGLFYDFGTHFLGESGNPQIDEQLFKGLEVDSFDYLKAGTFYKGLYEKNGFLSDENIENSQEYLNALINCKAQKPYNNLKEQLEGSFGEGYATHVLSPIVKKFFFTNPIDLIEDCHALFGLSRIIAGSSEETIELKKQNRFDALLAYHCYKEGTSLRKSIYPKEGGVGAWINAMEQELIKRSVAIVTDAEVGEITSKNSKITSVEINNTTLPLAKLIWTIPPFFLLSKLGIKLSLSPPKRLTSSIFHFLVDKNYLTDLYYFQCYDTELKSFRVTLYDNYSKGKEGKYRVSVEVLLEAPPEKIEVLQKEIFDELIQMSIFPKGVQVIDSAHNIYPNGFPVLTKDFISSSLIQYNEVMDNYSNVEIYGKGNGKTWFMNDIVNDIYKKNTI